VLSFASNFVYAALAFVIAVRIFNREDVPRPGNAGGLAAGLTYRSLLSEDGANIPLLLNSILRRSKELRADTRVRCNRSRGSGSRAARR